MRFLAWAYNYNFAQAWRHLTVRGRDADRARLIEYLNQTYQGKSYLYYNGRSALSVALKTLLGPKVKGARVGVNAYTCYAVVQAVRDLGAEVVYLEIERETYNYSAATLERAAKQERLAAVIIQNTLGVLSPIREIERVAKQHNLKIIEDLAHAVGLHYPDGRLVGTVGEASFFSFGRGKPVDTEHGAALVLRRSFADAKIYQPNKIPPRQQRRRDRLYPLLGWLVRRTYRIYLGRVLAVLSKQLGLVRGSVEGRVEPHLTLASWQARLALEQLQAGPKINRQPLLVKNRPSVVRALAKHGYHFSEIWWDVAVSPRRLFSQVGYNPNKTPVAFAVGETMLNLPTDLSASERREVMAIIQEHQGGA